jgi:hypothetical protein
MGLIDSIIGAESGGDPNATNPNSSAMGAGQFISSTWLDTLKSARPDLAQGKSDQELLALRSDPQLSREMTEAYAANNGRILAQAGHEATPGNTYLAHFAGPKGAVSVLSADPTTPAGQILGPQVVKANPFLANMTAGDLRAWADRKMGGSAPAPQPAPMTPAAAPGGLLASASQPMLPQGLLAKPPIFAPPPQPQAQAQAQPQQQQAEGGSIFDQMAPPQMAPLVFPQRRAPDLSRLKAAFRPPVFSRG